MNGRGVRGGTGNPEHEPIRRWNAASDLTSSSSGLDSAKRLSMRGCFNGNARRRLKIMGISASMLADDRLRGGVRGGGLCRTFLPPKSSRGGVLASEPFGESVIIRSLSPSVSSMMFAFWLRRRAWSVKEEARGLCSLVSDKYPPFCKRLGRRNRCRSKDGSSSVTDDDEAPGLDEEGGKAKSVEDVGREGREVALGITESANGVQLGGEDDEGEVWSLFYGGRVSRASQRYINSDTSTCNDLLSFERLLHLLVLITLLTDAWTIQHTATHQP